MTDLCKNVKVLYWPFEPLPPCSPVALNKDQLTVFKLGWLECEAAHQRTLDEFYKLQNGANP